VIPSPFSQRDLNLALQKMIGAVPGGWQAAGLEYGSSPALYRLAQNVVDAVEVGR